MTAFNDLSSQENPYADKFHRKLKMQGYDFATGVPCGVLRYFIANLANDSELIHVSSQHEPEAIGVASGAYLGGKKPVVYMQNSGLLKTVNELGSLSIAYRIPLLGIVTYRGCPGEDAPHHFITGRVTKPVLDELRVRYSELEKDNIKECIEECDKYIQEKKLPAVILVKRGSIPKGGVKTSVDGEFNSKYDLSDRAALDLRKGNLELAREEALDVIMDHVSLEDAIFSTTGLMSRSLYERRDSSNQFYNAGSFGNVSSEGLGFALARPDVKTIVVDGDASLLTNFGTLVTIGHYQPENLVHIVVDNGAYGSCSEEDTLSKEMNIAKTASIQGYRQVFVVDSAKTLEAILKTKPFGPILVQVKTKLGGRRDFKRPLSLPSIASRFKKHFG